jgi:2,3-dihydroxy-p-cumate/2,3-dihydroxybenzoate 3,4-dioxygenase
MKLRSVALGMPQVEEAAQFLQSVWGLIPVSAHDGTRYFRGTGEHPYILSTAPASTPGVRAIEFAGSLEEIERTRERVKRTNTPIEAFSELDAPGGGAGFLVRGPEAQAYRFIAESSATAALPSDRDRPIQLTHAVVNAIDVGAAERFVVDTLGFQVSDRTRIMTFVRCNRKHHCLAYAHAEVSSLNHLAFEMTDTDAVMRGIGRMRDAGVEAVWGPGRHGPGNNVFAYFIAPYGGVIEYTAEVSEVPDDYKVGTPDDWKWPPGRIDQWGISQKNTALISEAERVYRFVGASN